ncbi:MAG: hypothetical protein ACO1PB_02810 [Ramlibacter sp.]
MKPLWVHTLAWIIAAVFALLLALAGPDGGGGFELLLPHGAGTPR